MTFSTDIDWALLKQWYKTWFTQKNKKPILRISHTVYPKNQITLLQFFQIIYRRKYKLSIRSTTHNRVQLSTISAKKVFQYLKKHPRTQKIWFENEEVKGTGGFQVYSFLAKNPDFVTVNVGRVRHFLQIGDNCCWCGIQGTHFIIEQEKHVNPNSSTGKPGVHLDLFGRDVEGHEILMTQDHVILYSQGGVKKDKEGDYNLRPMCKVCNEVRGSIDQQEKAYKRLQSVLPIKLGDLVLEQ